MEKVIPILYFGVVCGIIKENNWHYIYMRECVRACGAVHQLFK